MKAGSLDRRIKIMREGAATDNGIEEIPGDLEKVYACWADWQPVAGREIFENLGKEAKTGGYFFIRHNSISEAILTTDKVSWEGRIYDIVANDPYERNERRRLTVTAGDDA